MFLKQLKIFFVALVFLLSASLGLKAAKDPVSLNKANLKYALIDLERVFSEYSYITEAMEDIQLKEVALKKLLIIANQELDKLSAEIEKDGKTTEINFEQKKNEIQASVDKAYTDLEEKKKDYNLTLTARLDMTLDKFAKSEKYDLILNKAYVLEETNDLTDAFLKHLEALK